MRGFIKTVVFIVVIPLGAISIFVLTAALELASIPEDADLISTLDRKRKELEIIAQYAHKMRPYTPIYATDGRSGSNLQSKIQRLLRKVDPLFVRYDGCAEIVFYYSTRLTTIEKALVHCGAHWRPLLGRDQIVDSTDPFHSLFQRAPPLPRDWKSIDRPFYRHIGGDWFVKYEFLEWN